jgi:hypothetical protein
MTKFYCPNKYIYYLFSTINVSKFLNWYDLNMYIINVIADDEAKIGLYEIYFFKWLKFC